MKFELCCGSLTEKTKKFPTIRGFDRLEDACGAAYGLAQVQPVGGYVSVWVAKHKHHGREIIASVNPRWNDSPAKITADARRNLELITAKQRRQDERFEWLNRYPSRAFDVMLNHEPTRQAFYDHNFPAVAAYLESQGLTPKDASGDVTRIARIDTNSKP